MKRMGDVPHAVVLGITGLGVYVAVAAVVSMQSQASGCTHTIDGGAHASASAPSSSAVTNVTPLHVPCFPFNETQAATLDPPVLLQLQQHRARVSSIDDWTKLGVRTRPDLAHVWFAVPKVIHQVWVGSLTTS